MLVSLHHVAIICSDYQRSKRFYTETLGLTIIAETHRPERNSWKLDLAIPGDPPPRGAQIELFSFPDPPPRVTGPEARGLRHIAFAVTDLDSALARLAACGIPSEPVRNDELTGRRFTFIRDPDDLPIELYESGSSRRACCCVLCAVLCLDPSAQCPVPSASTTAPPSATTAPAPAPGTVPAPA